jgi:hypothetical protein
MASGRVVVLLALVAVALSKEIHELGDAQKDVPAVGPNGAHDAVNTVETYGTATGNTDLNMVGPAYGNPGYKESHKWETDSDVWAPIVFDWQFYQAMYSDTLADKTEAEVKADWETVANAEDAVYPNCRQGCDAFALNMYYRANIGLMATTQGKCRAILEEYLTQGVFDGKLTYASNAEAIFKMGLSPEELDAYNMSPKGKARALMVRKGSDREWALHRSSGNMGIVVDAAKYYTYTFWLKIENPVETEGNILEYGRGMPKISLGTNYGQYLKVVSAQTNKEDFGCNTPQEQGSEFGIALKTWTHIAVVAENTKLTVYLNGKMAVTCTNTGGEIAMSNHLELMVPADEAYADGKIKNLKYWVGAPLNKELVDIEFAKGPTV